MTIIAATHDTSVALVATILGGAAGLLALAAWTRGIYRRTLGRRRDHYERLGRLGTGAQLGFFIAVLEQPPAIRRTLINEDFIELELADPEHVEGDEAPELQEIVSPRAFTECFFIDRAYYVQTISDADETVIGFSVTTRRKRFRPIFEGPQRFGALERWRIRRLIGSKWTPLFRVQLGKTTFARLNPSHDPWPPNWIRAFVGARPFAYSEAHYYGNPGHYQTYVFTASSAAWGAGRVGELLRVTEELGTGGEWSPDEGGDWEELRATHAFRRETAVTTLTTVAPHFLLRNYPANFGPHGDEVRTIP